MLLASLIKGSWGLLHELDDIILHPYWFSGSLPLLHATQHLQRPAAQNPESASCCRPWVN